MKGGGEVLFWLLLFGLIALTAALVEAVEWRRRRRLPEPHHTAARSSNREEWDVGAGRVRAP